MSELFPLEMYSFPLVGYTWMLVLYICLKVVFEEDSAEILNYVIGERLRDISMLDKGIQARKKI